MRTFSLIVNLLTIVADTALITMIIKEWKK